jgi:hypothetical protein
LRSEAQEQTRRGVGKFVVPNNFVLSERFCRRGFDVTS